MLYDGTPGQNANTSLNRAITGFSRVRVEVLKKANGGNVYGYGSLEVNSPAIGTEYQAPYTAPDISSVMDFSVTFLSATSFKVGQTMSNVRITGHCQPATT